MPRIVRMPTKQELPAGATRDFVEELFDLYREAHRPALREISQRIERSDSDATASPETIRRMLRGATVPSSWAIVKAVFHALCEMAEVDPNQSRDSGYDEPSRRELIEIRWNEALDDPGPRPVTTSSFAGRSEADPWASSETKVRGYPDEPPF